MSNVKTHTTKDAIWKNASGDAVPVKFVPDCDKVKEKLASKIHSEALDIERRLQSFHKMLTGAYDKVSEMLQEEFKIKKSKKQTVKSFTWFNFDRSIKIEADVNDIVKWDEALMGESLRLLNEYVDSSLSDDVSFFKKLINDGFSNNKEGIDSRSVFKLLKYEVEVKNAKYSKACSLIKQAQSVDKTKLYQRIWEKMETGEYRNINLNFSSL